MVITDQAQFKQLVQEVRDQILSESQGVGEVDIVDNLDSIYSLPALKLNDNGDQVVEAPLSLLSAPAEEAAATANAAAQAANTAAESANSAASSANLATDKTNEAISNAQSATQQAKSSADKANTAAQKADEATAQVLSGESERVEAENARQAAETERQSAEEERRSAEEARKLAEQSREEAETSRVSAEESRVTAESERVTAESSRAQAETERVQKESERESAEQTRQQNETTRQSNETTRVQQEQTRQTNEEQRVSAESSRETEYADLKQRSDALIDDNEAAIENANTAAENANAAIANMENTYAKKDEIPDVSEFITISVDNLVNYYRKSETYNQEQINSLIGSITTINFKIVDSLPGTGENNLIYLVPSSKQEEKNVKDEYIWVDDSWELIGSTKIDLSNYYTRDEVNSTFALKTELAWDTITGKPVWIGSSKPTYTWSEINEKPTTLAGYGITDSYTKTESDNKYVTISTEQTITGAKTFTERISLNQKSIHITNASTYTATGFYWHKRSDGSVISAIGSKTTDGNTLDYLFLGWGTSPYDTETSLAVSNSFLKYKTYDILHTGNYTSTLDTCYVKKSGDTMTGKLSIVGPLNGLIIDSINDTDPYTYISIRHNGVQGGAYSAYNYIPYFYQYGWKKMWHEGNGGSGSGLDADLLDGVHYQNILERAYSKVTNLNSTGWCRIARTIPGNNGGISFKLFLVREYNYGTNESYSFDITINHNSNSASIVQTSGYANMRFIKKIRVTGSNNSQQYVDIYYDHTNVNNIRYTTIGCAESIDAERDVDALTYTTEFETTNGCKSSLGFVGALTGNADTATKLQTPRLIWGQSFDGTADVSGKLNGWTGNAVNWSDTWNDGVNDHPWYGYDHSHGTSSNRGVYNSTISDFYGICLRTESGYLVMTDSGNVGIGTTSPNYKLHVDGTFYASGVATLKGGILTTDMIVQNNLTVIGNITSDRDGVEEITLTELTNLAVYGNKKIIHINTNGYNLNIYPSPTLKTGDTIYMYITGESCYCYFLNPADRSTLFIASGHDFSKPTSDNGGNFIHADNSVSLVIITRLSDTLFAANVIHYRV